MITFNLKEDEEFIALIQLLKLMGLARSGGEAQQMVMNGIVSINGTVEYRKRAKLRHGDTISALGREIKVCKR